MLLQAGAYQQQISSLKVEIEEVLDLAHHHQVAPELMRPCMPQETAENAKLVAKQQEHQYAHTYTHTRTYTHAHTRTHIHTCTHMHHTRRTCEELTDTQQQLRVAIDQKVNS